jgi:UDP-glucose 4-epimerase
VSSAIAVTGASGYVGSRLVTTLQGRDVRALVRKQVDYLPEAQQHEIDLADGGAGLAEAFAGVDAVVHLAGLNEVVASQEPDRALAETAVASRHVATAARAAGVRRLVYVSTVHVYGALMVDGAVVSEDLPPEPRSGYAVARLASEHLIQEGSPLETVVLRLSNAVGAPASVGVDRWSLVATDLSRQAVATGTLTLRSSGLQWRDFVALSDVCRIVTAAADGAVAPGTYNLASGQPATVRHLAELVQDRVEARGGTRPELVAPDHQGPVPEPYRVAVDRLAGQGLTAGTPLVDAVDELVGFCIDHAPELTHG